MTFERRDVLKGASAALLASATASSNPAHAVQAAEAADLVLLPGENRIYRDRTVTGSLTVPAGARIVIGDGATLTLLGDVVAPPRQIFWGLGKVDLTRSRLLAARPEWWGARADDPSVDSRPALAACVQAHLVTALGMGSYYVRDTWKIELPNRRILGIGRAKDALGTRIVLTRGGRGTVMQIGTVRAPGSINNYVSGIELRGIELGRNAAPAADDTDHAIGLSVRHVLDCRLEDLRANEHSIGYSVKGAVRTYLRDCRAFRSLAGPADSDLFVGFDLDGRDPAIATGANASLFMIDCNAGFGGGRALSESIGIRLLGAMSDTFLTRFETTTLATGISIDGSSGRLGRKPAPFTHIDIHIDTPVLDQCSRTGIAVAGLGPTAMMEIRSPYVALSPTGTAAIAISDCGGSLRIAGGQLVGSIARDGTGLLVDRSSGTTADATALLGFAHPVVAREAVGFELQVAVIADSMKGGPAITLNRCRRGYIRPRLSGMAGAHSAAVAIDAASRALSIETIGIDPAVTGAGLAVTVAEKPVGPEGATSVVLIPS